MAEKANERLIKEADDALRNKINSFFEEYKETGIYQNLVATFFMDGKFDKTFVLLKNNNLERNKTASDKTYTSIIEELKSKIGKFSLFCKSLEKLTEGTPVGRIFCRDCIIPKIQSNSLTATQVYEIMKCYFTFKISGNNRIKSNYFLEALLETFCSGIRGSPSATGFLKTLDTADFSSGNDYLAVKNVLIEAFEIAEKNYKQQQPSTIYDPFAVRGVVASKPNIKKMKANVKNVFPSSFLNQKMPLTPYVQVEFKTQLDQENMTYDNQKLWQPILYNQNSHFISMELDDNKGIKRLTLNLFDKTYTELENIIAKTILVTNLKLSPDKEIETSSGGLTFAFSKSSFTNMRIRFGYQIKNLTDIEYKERIKYADQPIYQTDWLYFQILGFKQEATDAGMNFSINAISTGGNSFNNIKVLKKFAVIKGSPSKIIETFSNVLATTFKNEKANVKAGEEPIVILPFKKDKISNGKNIIANNNDSEYEKFSQQPWDLRSIEISLGEKPKLDKTGNPINEYKTFKEILDDLCSKVSPLYLDTNGDVSQIKEGQDAENMRVMKYTYAITEKKLESVNQIRIRFYYSNPDKMFEAENQPIIIRNYYWKNYGATVVKNLSISTETDFAQMNMPILTYNTEGNSYIKSISYSHVEKDKDGYIIETKKDWKDEALRMDIPAEKELYQSYFKTAIEKALKTDDFTFSARAIMPPVSSIMTPEQIAQLYMYQYAININSSIFRGTIELLGDPFFLFDDALAPYSYLIRIVVLRPSEKKIEYNENEPEKNQKAMSYLSGFYVITNIKHNISDAGYTTTLEVMKWPTVYEIPFGKDS